MPTRKKKTKRPLFVSLFLTLCCVLCFGVFALVLPQTSFGQSLVTDPETSQVQDSAATAANTRELLAKAYLADEHLDTAQAATAQLEGASDTLSAIEQKTEELCEGLESADERGQVIHDWIVSTIQPASTSEIDLANPYQAFTENTADSRGFAELARLMYQHAGIAALIIQGELYDGSPHWWNALQLNGAWQFADFTLDARYNNPEEPDIQQHFYRMSDEVHDAWLKPVLVEDFTGDIDSHPIAIAGARCITLDAGEGTCAIQAVAINKAAESNDGIVRRLPEASHETARFVGWFTEAEDGQMVSEMSDWLPQEDATLFAHWSYPIDVYTISDIEDQAYAGGDEICPKPTLTHGSTILQEGVDYSLSYEDNQSRGTARVSITGLGRYYGTTSTSFTIVSQNISEATVSVESVLYNGKAQSPKPVVSIAQHTLTQGIDYECSYSNNIQAGSATLIIEGKENYLGTKTVNFTIRRCPLSMVSIARIPNQNYTGKRIEPKLSLTYSGMTLVEGKDYSVLFNNNQDVGTAGAVLTGSGNYVGPASTQFKIVPKTRSMYRLYNPNSGEHFYTASAYERDVLKKAGWHYEGIGWYAPVRSQVPVYRLYNKNAGDHHYTTSITERNHLIKLGWRYEGIGWYSDDAKGVALYRQYNPNARTGTHNYTTSKAENNMLVSVGWRAEGIGWYGVKL